MRDNKVVSRIATVARILLALVFTVFGAMYFFTSVEMMPLDLSTKVGQFNAGMLATGYFMPFLKVVEIISGLMLFFKRFTALALVILAPIIINIALYGLFLAPEGLIMGIIISVLAVFLAWFNFDKYRPLFTK